VRENIFFTLFVSDFFNSSKLAGPWELGSGFLFCWAGGATCGGGYIRRHKEKSRANCPKGFFWN